MAGEICEIEIGGTPSRKEPTFWAVDRTGFPWVSIADMGDGEIVSTKEQISATGAAKSNTKLVPAGTTLMSFKLTVGKIAITGVDLYTNEAIAAFYPNRTFMSDSFLPYALSRAVSTVATDQAVKGVTLNKQKLKELRFLLPPLPEQKKIAAILSSVDETIQATRETIEQTKKVKQGLMQELLTRGIGHTRFKKTEIGEIPESWEIKSLDNLSMKITDGTHHSPKTQQVGFLYITSKNIKPFKLDIAAPCYVSQKDHHAIYARCDVKKGDVLYTKDGANTGFAVVNPLDEEFSLLSSVALIRTDSSKLLNSFLCQYLNSPTGFSRARGDMDGLAIKRLTLRKIKKILVPVPSVTEQAEIVLRLTSMDENAAISEAYLDTLQLLKKGLMQDLLTGKVRVAV